MPETKVTFEVLINILSERSSHQYARNLVLVALPIQLATRTGKELAQYIGGEWIDFDCELLQQFEQDDWDEHVALEDRGTRTVGRRIAERWLKSLGTRLNRQRPIVLGNINLAVSYEIDVAKAIYDFTERGMCVIAAGGTLHGETLLIHGVLPQTGASSPAYEVIIPQWRGDSDPPHTIQDRLF